MILKLIKKIFFVGQWVLLFNFRLRIFLCKLNSKWLGSFLVKGECPHGVIELHNLGTNIIPKVNG